MLASSLVLKENVCQQTADGHWFLPGHCPVYTDQNAVCSCSHETLSKFNLTLINEEKYATWVWEKFYAQHYLFCTRKLEKLSTSVSKHHQPLIFPKSIREYVVGFGAAAFTSSFLSSGPSEYMWWDLLLYYSPPVSHHQPLEYMYWDLVLYQHYLPYHSLWFEHLAHFTMAHSRSLYYSIFISHHTKHIS